MQDQSLQESGVKVETLERRLEATRKQADQIIELENDVAKAKKQEKVYSDAIEQLQAEQDSLEAENAKLRQGQGVDVKAHASNPVGLGEAFSLPGGGLEVTQLAEQVCPRPQSNSVLRKRLMIRSKICDLQSGSYVPKMLY